MRAEEIKPKKLVIFDIDDTLVKTDTKVNVVKDGKIVDRLSSHDFTHYKLKPGEEFDFGAFTDAKEFFEKARPILPMINQLKHDINTGNKVIMITARADFNDRDIFLNTFKRFGINMNKVHVYRAGNIQGKIPTEKKKKLIIKKNDEAIKQALKNLILTNLFERPFRPLFGSDITKTLFENYDPITESNLETFILTAIQNYEPRVIVSDINIFADPDLS